MSRSEQRLRQELELMRRSRDEWEALAHRLTDRLVESQAQTERLLKLVERT